MSKLNTSSSRAIVLSHEIFGEADKYVQFLTERWGIITALAKSARKSKRRFVGGLDYFSHCEIFIKGQPRERNLLLELSVLNSFPLLRDNVDKILFAGKTVQWIRKLAPHSTPLPNIYSALGQTLALLEKEDSFEKFFFIHIFFRIKLLTELGLKPHLESCIRCNEALSYPLWFGIAEGGILCHACKTTTPSPFVERYQLNEEEYRFLRTSSSLRFLDWNTHFSPDHSLKNIGNIVTAFASYHAQVSLPN